MNVTMTCRSIDNYNYISDGQKKKSYNYRFEVVPDKGNGITGGSLTITSDDPSLYDVDDEITLCTDDDNDDA